jgi:hypothetical protein
MPIWDPLVTGIMPDPLEDPALVQAMLDAQAQADAEAAALAAATQQPVAEPILDNPPVPVAEPVLDNAPAPTPEPILDNPPAPVPEPILDNPTPTPVAEPILDNPPTTTTTTPLAPIIPDVEPLPDPLAPEPTAPLDPAPPAPAEPPPFVRPDSWGAGPAPSGYAEWGQNTGANRYQPGVAANVASPYRGSARPAYTGVSRPLDPVLPVAAPPSSIPNVPVDMGPTEVPQDLTSYITDPAPTGALGMESIATMGTAPTSPTGAQPTSELGTSGGGGKTQSVTADAPAQLTPEWWKTFVAQG